MSGCRRAGHITGCIAGHILCVVCLGVFIYTIGINIHLSIHICYAEDLSEQKTEDNNNPPYGITDINSSDYKDIDKTIKKETGLDISYGKIMQSLISGGNGLEQIKDISAYITEVVKTGRNEVVQVVCLCIFSAVLNVLTPLFNEKQLKDTAAGIISVSLVTILLSVFMGVFMIAQDAVTSLINIYKVISMVFFPAVCATGSPLSAAGYYQIVIWMMAAADIFIRNILMNLNRVYVCVSLCDCVDKEAHFSKLCGFIQKGIKWCGYTMMTVFMGLNGIKSIINPVKDSINTSYVYKAVSIIPGIGDAASMLSQTVIASSSLIKNTIGAAGVIALVLCMSFPVIKLVVISCIYQGVAAVMEPVADKRIIRAVQALTSAVGCLTYLVIISSVLFILTIVIVCIATGR